MELCCSRQQRWVVPGPTEGLAKWEVRDATEFRQARMEGKSEGWDFTDRAWRRQDRQRKTTPGCARVQEEGWNPEGSQHKSLRSLDVCSHHTAVGAPTT